MFQHLFVTLLMYFITINCGTSSSDIMIDSDDSVEANREVYFITYQCYTMKFLYCKKNIIYEEIRIFRLSLNH